MEQQGTKYNNLKLKIIGTVGVPANYGGFETLVENLLDYLPKEIETTVFCSSHNYAKKISIYKNARLRYLIFKANGVQSIIYDIVSLILSLGKNNTLLVLGTSGAIIFPLIKILFPSINIICNIDGIEWKRAKWNFFAKKYLQYSEFSACKYADTIITDNRGIYDHVLKSYQRKSQTIPYGAFITNTNNNIKKYLLKYNLKKNEYAIKVCRIEPENNVELVLESFSILESQTIVIIGNWKNSKFGNSLRNKYSSFSNIILLDPIYDQVELNALRSSCEFYVHGHSAGGTNPSLVEAIGLNIPILAYDVNFNRYTLDNNGHYFSSVNSLVNLIKNKNELFDKMYYESIKNLFETKYTWNSVGKEYKKLITT